MRDTCLSTLLVEDEKVRVTRFDFKPGEETGWHVHEYDYVITAITDCFMILKFPDGKRQERRSFQGMHTVVMLEFITM